MPQKRPNMQGIKTSKKQSQPPIGGLREHVKKAQHQQEIMRSAIQNSVKKRQRPQFGYYQFNEQEQIVTTSKKPQRKSTSTLVSQRYKEYQQHQEEHRLIPDKPRKKRRQSQYQGVSWRAWLPITVIVLTIGGVLAIAHTMLSKIEIAITPAQHTVAFEVPVTFQEGASDPTLTNIEHKTVEVEATAVKSVPVYDIEEVVTYATGTVTLYNEMPAPQTLSEKTRLESSNGTLFYITTPTNPIIPAAKNGIAGTIEVGITAAVPGSSGNVGFTDFVIPGWREAQSPKFEKQYGRATVSIEGGGISNQPKISKEQENALAEGFVKELTTTVKARIEASLPDDFIVIEDATVLQFSDVIVKEQQTASAKVAMSATAKATLIPKELAHMVIEQYGDREGELARVPIQVQQLSKIVLQNPSFKEDGSISGILTGRAIVSVPIDVQDLEQKFYQRTPQQIEELSRDMISVGKIEGSLRPKWRKNVTKKPEITIISLQ